MKSLIAAILALFTITLANLILTKAPTNAMPIILTSDKSEYHVGEAVKLKLENNSGQNIFLAPAPHNTLSWVGQVFMMDDDGNTPLKTFDQKSAALSPADITTLKPIKVKAGGTINSEWATDSLTGHFKIVIKYSASATLARNGTPDLIVASQPFEIK